MPIVLLDHPRGSSEWRGTINPAENEYDKTQGGWSGWFDSYRAMMGRFAMVAQLNNADVLVVGSELVSSEEHVDQWLRTIADVRGIFKGNLTYSANWDHYSSIQFWDRLDMIGMNSYWKLGEDRNVTVDQIQTRWQAIKRQLQEFQHTQGKGKPLLFLEAGWCSLANAASEPWDYTQTGAQVDTDLQKRLYQAFFETWYGDQSLGGFSIWEWTCNADERGYTPEAKPAYDVLRQWLAKPRWVVK